MKKTISVANVVVQNSSSEVLLLQRSPNLKHGNLWGLPGGMVDEDETELEAAIRELDEETGLDIVTRTRSNSFLCNSSNDLRYLLTSSMVTIVSKK